MDKTRSLSLIAVALLATLPACKQEASTPQESASTAAAGATAGISARDGKLVLSPVSGRPGAVYFTVRNDGSSPVALTGVDVAGAGKAQMHETSGGTMKSVDSLPIAPGAELEFAPGGLHVMVFDISPALKPGQTTDLTLAFADGQKLKMPVMVDSMNGGGDDDMGGMGGNMGPMPSSDGGGNNGNQQHHHSDGMGNMQGMKH